MRPFRTEDEGLLFAVAKLAFAECDDERTLATLTRDTVFVAELAGETAGYVAIEESTARLRIEQLCVHPAHEKEGVGKQLLEWAEGYAIAQRRGPARGRRRAWERPRRVLLPRPWLRPGRAGSARARPSAGPVASSFVLPALAFPAAASAHARLVGSKPADGAVLATPPADVKLLFDDEVRPAGGDRGRRRAGPLGARRAGARLAGNDRSLVLPLRPASPAARTASAGGSSRTTATWSPASSRSPSAPGRPRPVLDPVRRRRGVGLVGLPAVALLRRRARRRRGGATAGPARLGGSRWDCVAGRPRLDRRPAASGSCAIEPARRRDPVRPGDRDRGNRRAGRRRGGARSIAVRRRRLATAAGVAGARSRRRWPGTRSTRTACAGWSRSPTSSHVAARRSGSAGCPARR